MRKLTIKRQKSIVACLMKVKFYIEDKTMGDHNINGISCRLLSKLKNGEEKTFDISEDSARIFAFVSTAINFTFFTIPTGKKTVYICGKNVFNPLQGNPFIFQE